jgi:Xaa-Pro dipeptidase
MKSVGKRIGKVFKHTSADAILILNTQSRDPNFSYLTDFTDGVFESTLLIVKRNKEILITSPLEYQAAKRQKPREMLIVNATTAKQIMKTLTKHLKGRSVGVNESFMPYKSYRALKKYSKAKRFVDVSNDLGIARSVKDDEEISRMRTANRIAIKALKNIQQYFKEGITEKEIGAKFDQLMNEYGASRPSFSTIVCFGANSSIPHHVPGETRLRKNSFVLIDCGAKYKNYCSDVTRTFIFKPDKRSEKYKRMVDMYNTVKKAQALALKDIKIGARQSLPHITAENYINRASGGIYKGRFIHSLGHSIGIEVHDPAVHLSPNSKGTLKENMVVSDEPGIYIPKFGGVRIEDDIIVKKKGGRLI